MSLSIGEIGVEKRQVTTVSKITLRGIDVAEHSERSREASGHDFSRATSNGREGKGFSPCDVETVPTVGQIGCILFCANVLRHHWNGGRQIAVSNDPDDGSVR